MEDGNIMEPGVMPTGHVVPTVTVGTACADGPSVGLTGSGPLPTAQAVSTGLSHRPLWVSRIGGT
jgi:hypothetical protein